jgi:C1A family cysteine protease
MQRKSIFFQSHRRNTGLVLLSAFLVCCGLVLAGPAAAQPSSSISPDIKAQLELVRQDLTAKGHSFQVGYSPAMEKTVAQLCGLFKPSQWRQLASFTKTETYLTAIPSSFDWRDPLLGGNTPVRDQGSCGGCWAFGTIGPLEILISAKCGRVENLSEQYLLSCNENGWGCGGGWFAHDYHQWYIPTSKGETAAGTVFESIFPYQAVDAACNGPHSHFYKIDNWSYIAGYTVPSPAAIKQAIQNHGPIAAGVCVGNAFQAYKSGIFDYNEVCSGDVNHAVTLVGWNDDLGLDNGYWILKNSWGSAWGEGGYMRVRYGTSKVGYGANFIDFTNCSGVTPGLACPQGAIINPGTTYMGETTLDGANHVSAYSCTSRVESGPEKVYQVTTTTAGDLTAMLSNQSNDLDVFILSDCDPKSCRAFGANTATYANAPAGTYYLVVDGNNGAQGTYDLKATTGATSPPPTPTLNCSTATALTMGKAYNGKTLATDPAKVSRYACTNRIESGPEKVHKVTTTVTGDLTATLTNLSGKDLDVIILNACDPTACVAFGDTQAIYANAPPGTYYLVVDGNNGALGSYTLTPTLVTPAPDLTSLWTSSLTSSNAGKTVTGTLKVSNIGDRDAGAFTVGYYASTDGVKLGSLLLSQTLTALKTGQITYLTPVITSSSSLRGKYIVAKPDSAGKITERNETNNTAAARVP